ncbi:MAG: hypothetical protein MRERV_3c106 [Mycoplasmataceae bacterium RV_VA103A]|nr:MAG: hypothetical protein MRERV_3c106 [Mycoplasmataceae bacterium RV_VA103A]
MSSKSLIKILSIDPSGNGTTGICLIWGQEKFFYQFVSKKWQEHYQYVLNLVKKEKPLIILIETSYYEQKGGASLGMFSLKKLVGALECLKFHTSSQVITIRNQETKKWGQKIKTGKNLVPGLIYKDKKLFYKELKISQHQADALIIYYLYDRSHPYIKSSP